jgi:FAD/FMN-containing dehydrogenase
MLPVKDNSYLLVEQECTTENPYVFEPALGQCIADGLLIEAIIGHSKQNSPDFLPLRDASGHLPHHFWPNSIFNVSIPISEINHFVCKLRSLLQPHWPEVKMIVFGHAADGNTHTGVQVGETPSPLQAIDQMVYTVVGNFNGLFSAEHGIGTLKKAYLGHSKSAAEIAQMRALKTMFDPAGLLNPGKVFDML